MATFDFTQLQKEKYLEIAKKQSIQTAVTELHHDLWQLEKECFEGRNGYIPEAWKHLNEMRLFSRELWDLKLN